MIQTQLSTQLTADNEHVVQPVAECPKVHVHLVVHSCDVGVILHFVPLVEEQRQQPQDKEGEAQHALSKQQQQLDGITMEQQQQLQQLQQQHVNVNEVENEHENVGTKQGGTEAHQQQDPQDQRDQQQLDRITLEQVEEQVEEHEEPPSEEPPSDETRATMRDEQQQGEQQQQQADPPQFVRLPLNGDLEGTTLLVPVALAAEAVDEPLPATVLQAVRHWLKGASWRAQMVVLLKPEFGLRSSSSEEVEVGVHDVLVAVAPSLALKTGAATSSSTLDPDLHGGKLVEIPDASPASPFLGRFASAIGIIALNDDDGIITTRALEQQLNTRATHDWLVVLASSQSSGSDALNLQLFEVQAVKASRDPSPIELLRFQGLGVSDWLTATIAAAHSTISTDRLPSGPPSLCGAGPLPPAPTLPPPPVEPFAPGTSVAELFGEDSTPEEQSSAPAGRASTTLPPPAAPTDRALLTPLSSKPAMPTSMPPPPAVAQGALASMPVASGSLQGASLRGRTPQSSMPVLRAPSTCPDSSSSSSSRDAAQTAAATAAAQTAASLRSSERAVTRSKATASTETVVGCGQLAGSDSIMLHVKPGTDSALSGAQLDAGEQVEVLGRACVVEDDVREDWLHVRCGTKQGWLRCGTKQGWLHEADMAAVEQEADMEADMAAVEQEADMAVVEQESTELAVEKVEKVQKSAREATGAAEETNVEEATGAEEMEAKGENIEVDDDAEDGKRYGIGTVLTWGEGRSGATLRSGIVTGYTTVVSRKTGEDWRYLCSPLTGGRAGGRIVSLRRRLLSERRPSSSQRHGRLKSRRRQSQRRPGLRRPRRRRESWRRQPRRRRER